MEGRNSSFLRNRELFELFKIFPKPAAVNLIIFYAAIANGHEAETEAVCVDVCLFHFVRSFLLLLNKIKDRAVPFKLVGKRRAAAAAAAADCRLAL